MRIFFLRALEQVGKEVAIFSSQKAEKAMTERVQCCNRTQNTEPRSLLEALQNSVSMIPQNSKSSKLSLHSFLIYYFTDQVLKTLWGFFSLFLLDISMQYMNSQNPPLQYYCKQKLFLNTVMACTRSVREIVYQTYCPMLLFSCLGNWHFHPCTNLFIFYRSCLLLYIHWHRRLNVTE